MGATLPPTRGGVWEKSPRSSVRTTDDRHARRIARFQQLARRQASELPELRIEVRLVVVAGGACHVGERGGAALDHRERPPKADEARVDLRRDADLIAERRREARLRKSRLLTQAGDRDGTLVRLDLGRDPRDGRI